jgi:hypothetical protein
MATVQGPIYGNIVGGSSVFLATFLPAGTRTGLAILNTLPGPPVNYYWETNFDQALSPAIFRINQQSNLVTFVDTINDGGLALNNLTLTFGATSSPLLLNLNQNINSWSASTVAYNGITVNISGSSNAITGSSPYSFYLDTTLKTLTPATNIFIVSITGFAGCTSTSYDLINQPAQAIINWYCFYNPNDEQCQAVNTVSPVWTNLSDCNSNWSFAYCLNTDKCGTNGCKGPCSQVYFDCDFPGTCTFNSQEFIATEEQNPWAIGIAVGIIAAIIVLIFLVFWFTRSKNNSQKEKTIKKT